MYIAILGRQPALGLAELERLFGNVRRFSDHSALIDTDAVIDIERLGGSLKVGRVVLDLPGGKKNDWRSVSMAIVNHYAKKYAGHEGKITLGISAYEIPTNVREVQKTGIVLKGKLKTSGVSLRLIPNAEPALSTATSHHNKLGLSDNKIELIIAQARNGQVVIAESVGSQNITALAARDQGRPKRDAFVGMLPPKLAQIMINLAAGDSTNEARLLDPFCGTGVILQEAALLGYSVYGTDLSEKMIRYSRDNLNWLQDSHRISFDWYLHEGDATDTKWQQPIDIVTAETYLGQPFSAPPSATKLTEVRGNCDHITRGFLKNLAAQTKPSTPVCIAIPAWRAVDGSFTHLPLIKDLAKLGFTEVRLSTVKPEDLLYYREDQVVARELLILKRS